MKNPKYNVPTLRKAVRLFEFLSESAVPLGISEISRRLGINKVMIMKLVRTMSDEGWLVESEGPKYSLSLKPFHFVFSRLCPESPPLISLLHQNRILRNQ